ncbi:MAG: hypothetical protein V9G15_16105 [Dermatophilaceae bacterium]
MTARLGDPVSQGGAAPTRVDPVAASASRVIGGPLGRYAGPGTRGWRPVGAWLAAASTIPMALGVWERGYCIAGGWQTPDQFFHMCFSDLPATYASAGLDRGIGAFLAGGAGAPIPAQPPLTALVLSLTGGLIPAGGPENQARLFFGFWAVLSAALVALLTWWTAGTVQRMPLRASQVALSPVVALTVLVAPDILGVALAAAALYAWSRSRIGWAGALLGLAIAARSYPLLILAAIVMVSIRAGRARVAAVTAGYAAVTAVSVYALVAVRNPSGAVAAIVAWRDADAGFGSGSVLPHLAGAPLPTFVVSGLAVTGWLAALLVGAYLALGAPRRPGVAEVALVMVVVVLVTGKSFPVQSSLWLVPLVALVGLSWRDHLLWAGAEALHFGGVWLYLAGISVADRGLPAGWYAVTLIARLVAVAWLAALTWRLAWRRPPEETPAPGDLAAGDAAGSAAGGGAGGAAGSAAGGGAGGGAGGAAGTDAGGAAGSAAGSAAGGGAGAAAGGAAGTDAGSGGASAAGSADMSVRAVELTPVPEPERIASGHETDPMAGPLAGAPDALLVRFS